MRWAALALIGAALAGCGGSSHTGTTAATPPSSSTSSVATSSTSSSVVTSSTPSVATAPHQSPTSGADWPTYHAAGTRAGAVSSGPPLGHVRRLWSVPVDGAVYAEPLVVGGRVIVATENDSVYALDAATGGRLWRVHVGTPVPGGSLPCGNIGPSGITSTPVVDAATGTVYVVAYRSGFRHLLVALDAGTGAVRWERPIDPPGGNYTTEQQRAALALANGHVYIAYGGLFGDCGRYHGWVVSAPATGPSGPLQSYQVPSQNEGAIWAPSGPAVDAAGNLYVATGNGNSSSFDYGNAVIKLSAGLKQLSFFAPPNAGALDTTDSDLGSTGPLLLPGGRAFIIGKSGIAYLLDADNLGGLGNGLASLDLGGAAFGGDAYAAGTVYVPTVGGIVAVRVGSNSLHVVWRQVAAPLPPIVAGPGVWAIGNGVLYQLDPATGAVRYHASVGGSAHFATPSASGGRIFVGSGERVQAFG